MNVTFLETLIGIFRTSALGVQQPNGCQPVAVCQVLLSSHLSMLHIFVPVVGMGMANIDRVWCPVSQTGTLQVSLLKRMWNIVKTLLQTSVVCYRELACMLGTLTALLKSRSLQLVNPGTASVNSFCWGLTRGLDK